MYNEPRDRAQMFMNRPKFANGIASDAEDGVGNLYFYQFIGESFWEEGITAQSVRAALADMGKVERVNVYINSPGGDVFEGVTIQNMLERHDAYVAVHVDGIAASIASVIAMAGDEINIAANGMLMIHDPWSFAMGDADELRKTADVLDKIRDQIADTYARRSGGDKDEIVALMAAETWMTADEAIAAGFATAKTQKVDAQALAWNLSGFKNAPKIEADDPPALDETALQRVNPATYDAWVKSARMRKARQAGA